MSDKQNKLSQKYTYSLADFDELIDRRGTNCVKYDFCSDVFGTDDILPMWMADMDFRTPDFVFDAIKERSKHPVLGYSRPPQDYFSVVSDWIKNLHNWDVKEDWMGFLPGIVPGLSFAIQVYTQIGDEVVIQPPVYHPFIHCVKENNRTLVYNPLKMVDGYFEMDFDDLERKITDKTKLFILCNPHNPGGKVWSRETLVRLAEICSNHGITVVSDEIHSDMVLHGYKHTPFASVSEEAKKISITYMAPSKSFNMPGLITSYYIIPNQDLRAQFSSFLKKNDLIGGNIFAYAATKAVYLHGSNWLQQMLKYVQGNIDYVVEFLKKNIPQIKPIIPQASFLIFLNCKDLGFGPDDLQRFFIEKAKIGMNDGRMFGPGGEYHVRMNIACPRSTVEEAMNRIKQNLS